MQTILEDLKNRFDNEGNNTGSLFAKELSKYLQEFTDKLQAKVESEKDKSSKPVNKIFNAMIDVNYEENFSAKKFFPVLRKEEGYCILDKEQNSKMVLENINNGIKQVKSKENFLGSPRINVAYVYVDAKLDEVLKLTEDTSKKVLSAIDSDGKEYELEYFLYYSDLAVKQLKRIWSLAKLYGCETPILYAPYAARLFAIEVDLGQLSENANIKIDKIDFAFKKNNIDVQLLFNQELVWNVKYSDAVDFEERMSPVGEVTHYNYFFENLSKDEYVISKEIQQPTFQVRIMDEKNVVLDFEGIRRDKFDKWKIYNINEKDFENIELFKSSYSNLGQEYHRLRSVGDINYELNKFMALNGISLSCLFKYDKQEKIISYKSDMSLYDNGRFGYKNTNKAYIVFEGNTEEKFFHDYANYVIGNLTYRYPEIGWEGVY